ncbi:MAG: hypothetical protein KDA32_06175 [Phycisphaerales bacterium]|nr:hypothetical protein [Phycisphaerales bacterium]
MAPQQKPLPPRVALLVSGEDAARFADLVRRSEVFEVVAQAGMPRNEAVTDIEWHNDARALLAQSGVDAVIVAGSAAEGVNAIQLAAECGKHAWRWGPIARDLAEGLDCAERMKAAKRVLWPASWLRHVQPLLSESFISVARGATYITFDLCATGPSYQSWRASLRGAAGGVLAQDGFFWLEAMIALRGLPEFVQAVTRRDQHLPGAPPRETEDLAGVLLRYADALVSVRATWDIQEGESRICWHAPAGGATDQEPVRASAVLKQAGVVVSRGGTAPTIKTPEMTGEAWVIDDLRRFAGMIQDTIAGEQAAERAARHEAALARRLPGLARREPPREGDAPNDVDWALELSLATTALLETVYLSARTMSPEQPRKLYEAQRCPCPF